MKGQTVTAVSVKKEKTMTAGTTILPKISHSSSIFLRNNIYIFFFEQL